MTYSSSLSMSRQRFTTRNQNAVSFRRSDKRLGPISNTIMLIILACLLGLLYLTQVTKTVAYGYKINDLSVAQTSLTHEHDELEVESARLQSVERVRDSEVAKGLVSVAPSETLQD